MRFWVLSRNRFLYSTRRLIKAARDRGHEAVVVNPLSTQVLVGENPAVLYEGEPIHADIVIPRIGPSITEYGLAVLRQIELLGIRTLSGSEAIARARDKVSTTQTIAAAGLPVPATILARTGDDVVAAVEAVGGMPVVVKTFRGTQGVGVVRVESMASLRSILDLVRSLGQDLVIQRYVSESAGRDLRAIVINGRIAAAMRRFAAGDDFRANLHRGGHAEQATLDPETARIAIAAADAVGLDVCGVDMLEAASGPLVLEVNGTPGLEGIEGVTGRDLAGEIVDYAASLLAEPLPQTAQSDT